MFDLSMKALRHPRQWLSPLTQTLFVVSGGLKAKSTKKFIEIVYDLAHDHPIRSPIESGIGKSRYQEFSVITSRKIARGVLIAVSVAMWGLLDGLKEF
jgi:hypothetical protein